MKKKINKTAKTYKTTSLFDIFVDCSFPRKSQDKENRGHGHT